MRPGFLRCLRAQLKCIIRYVLPGLLCSALLLGGIGLLSGVLLERENGGETGERIRVGLLGDMDDQMVRLGVFALRNMDSSRLSIDLVELDSETEARSMLRAGTINAYVRIPEGFTRGVYTGDVTPLTYVSTDGAVGIGTVLTDEIVRTVGELLCASENAVYGAQRYAADKVPGADPGRTGDLLVEEFLAAILTRDDLIRVEVLGVGSGLTLPEYYLCSLVILFLLFWGITCSPLFAGRDMELRRMLKGQGFGPAGQVLAEYIPYGLWMLSTLAVLALAAWAALRITGGSALTDLLPEETDWARFFLHLVPVALMLAAGQFLLYECTSGLIQGVLGQFLGGIVLGYLCGCLYPISVFPEAVQRLSRWLPPGLGREYLAAGLRGDPAFKLLAEVLGMAIVFLAAGMVCRRVRLGQASDLQEGAA